MFSKRTAGFTLIEMIIAIVIISIGLAGVLLAFNVAVKSSADPLIHKQMLAVAEEMMEEILLKPYTVTGTAPTNSLVSCGAAGSSRLAFNDVADYNNYQTAGICDIEGTAVAGLAGYNVSVAVDPVAWQGITAANALRITVTVTHSGETISLVGWRTWYACDPTSTVCPP